MKTAVAYARYSSTNQREESIDAQLRAIRQYCEYNDINLIGIYTDEALTAKNDKREDFQRMINALIKQEIVVDFVLVHKFNRFARNKFDSFVYKKKLKEKGVRVVSVTQKIDDTPEGELMEGFLEVMDEYYSANLSIEVKKGLRENALKGRFVGGKTVLGYNVVDGFYVINDQAEIVQRIFKDYAAGVPRSQICENLNKQGFRNRNGDLFKVRTIGDMLRNEKYIGIFRYRLSEKETIVLDNVIPAIIDRDLWNKVQETHKTPIKKRPNGKNTYHLTGKLTCGHCGSTMSGGGGGKVLKSGEVLNYYKCVGKSSHKNGCPSNSVNKKWIEQAVALEAIKKVMSEEATAQIAAVIYEQISAIVNKSASKVEALRKELKQLDDQQARLTKLYLKGNIAENILDEENEALQDRKHNVENDLLLLDMSAAGSLEISESDVADYLNEFFAELLSENKESPDALVQALVGTYVDNVIVDRENVQIYLKLDFPTFDVKSSDNRKFGGAFRRLSPLNYTTHIKRKFLKLHNLNNINF